MKKLILTLTITIAICLITFHACAPKEKLLTIGIAEFNESPMNSQTEQGLLDAIREGGYRDGENIRFLIQNAQGDFPTVNAISRNLISRRVDLICCCSTPNLQNTIHLTQTIPVFFTSVANPFLAGAGTSETDHLPNVTGVATRSPFDETIAVIRELMPDVRSVGTIYTPAEINSEYYLECQQEAAGKFDIEVIALPVNASSDMADVTRALGAKNLDAIYQLSDNLTNLGFEAIVKVANQAKLPLFCNQSTEAQRGAAVGVGWDFYQAGYVAGKMVLRVLKGEKPADIPIQYMRGAALTLNLPAAAIQGLELPEAFIARAETVFR